MSAEVEFMKLMQCNNLKCAGCLMFCKAEILSAIFCFKIPSKLAVVLRDPLMTMCHAICFFAFEIWKFKEPVIIYIGVYLKRN